MVREDIVIGGIAIVATAVYLAWSRATTEPIRLPQALPLPLPPPITIDPYIRLNSLGEPSAQTRYVPPAPPEWYAAPEEPVAQNVEPLPYGATDGDTAATEADTNEILEDFHSLPLETSGSAAAATAAATAAAVIPLTPLETADTPPSEEPQRFRYIRLKISQTREPGAPYPSLGGIIFKELAQKTVDSPRVSVWDPHTGERTNYSETALIDRYETIYHFPSPVSIQYYQLLTSRDSMARDPARWRIDGSMNGVFWYTLDDRSQRTWILPEARGVWTTWKRVGERKRSPAPLPE